jgi:adenosylcobinamide-GDP ribazoletransferase
MFGRLWAAFGFLTILPLPAWCRQTEADLPRSVTFFPFVGVVIGGVAGGVAYLTASYLPPAVAAVAYTLLLAVAHGGLHLDGLADTGDGFFSHRQRERILAIMQDSRMGAYGGVTLLGVLGLKVAALASLSPLLLVKALFLAPLAGRCAMVLMLVVLPTAREEGMGALFKKGRSFCEAIWALTLLGVCAWWAFHWDGLVTIGVVLAISVAFMGLCQRKIGGFTGDTLGALSEITEAVTLVTLSILLL